MQANEINQRRIERKAKKKSKGEKQGAKAIVILVNVYRPHAGTMHVAESMDVSGKRC